jgi:hypothetical protein
MKNNDDNICERGRQARQRIERSGMNARSRKVEFLIKEIRRIRGNSSL